MQALARAVVVIITLTGCSAEPRWMEVDEGERPGAPAPRPATPAPRVDEQAPVISEETREVLAAIASGAADASRVAIVGAERYALVGPRASELVAGRRYALVLATTREPARDGLTVKTLVSHRRLLRVIGTLADDATDTATMRLVTLHGARYVLGGATVSAFKEVRAALPTHDYSGTLFEAEIVEPREAGASWDWLGYTAAPRFRCAREDAPSVRIDLSVARPDETLLDGFVRDQLGGREARYGAHVECRRADGGFACALDDLGVPWATAAFVPHESAPFPLVVRKIAGTEESFRCEAVSSASLAALSEG